MFDDINTKIMDINPPNYRTEEEKDKLHQKILDLMRDARHASSRYDESAEQSDLDEMNKKQMEIIGMFDKISGF